MGIIVFDSSTLILLAKINLLKKVYLYYDKIIIPEHVFKETIEKGKTENKEDAYLIEKEIKDKKINILKIKNKNILDEILKNFKCNLGEAEAISLAIDKKSTLFTDDSEAMKICKVYDIEFITALAFLIKLVQDNKVDKEDALIKFQRLAKLGYYSKEILDYAFEECNKKWNK
ncbi:MAG: hypothetical protein AABW45_01525 [Nanoarchaeota archaeon]